MQMSYRERRETAILSALDSATEPIGSWAIQASASELLETPRIVNWVSKRFERLGSLLGDIDHDITLRSRAVDFSLFCMWTDGKVKTTTDYDAVQIANRERQIAYQAAEVDSPHAGRVAVAGLLANYGELRYYLNQE